MATSEILNIFMSFITLTVMEIILGIDNLVFLAIVSQKLPEDERKTARKIGLSLAWMMRLVMLALAFWLVTLTHPVFTLMDHAFSWRDLFLIGGGTFLLWKATQEMHNEMTPHQDETASQHHQSGASFSIVISQIVILDIVFSVDSILTAVGLTHYFWLMAIVITIAIIVMLAASEPLTHFIHKHPTIKMLALSFLLLIGMMLVTDGFGVHISRNYIYFAMGFSLFVELINIRRRKQT